MKRKIIIAIILVFALIGGNVLYWVTSDIQQECYKKIKNKTELNLYEKCSIYAIHLSTCIFGWFLSPESTRQQIWCLVPTDKVIVRSSRYFSRHEKIKSMISKYPSATINNPVMITWKAGENIFGMHTAYTIHNMRIALACNGAYLYKENNTWVIAPIPDYAYPKLSEPTIIGPFKFHEGLIRYMQDIGWLHKPRFKWVLTI